jgi:hypothetical protein
VRGTIVGLILLGIGIYFFSLPVVLFGLLCVAVSLYSTKSKPVVAQREGKTKHTVVMGEPPEMPIYPWMAGGIPLSQIDVNAKLKRIDEKLDDLKAQEETEDIRMEIEGLEKRKIGLAKDMGKFDFLPLPKYGYSDPLERIFLGFPIRFWEKKE